tara:strand:- start:1203 stop:1631 length:429 start_codon:yes stop_codon:yes gene_type:complete
MQINYPKILKKNMLNVFKDIILYIKNNGLDKGHHLYINFDTTNKKVVIPDWLKAKHPEEMTIIIQYEYWNLNINNTIFEITLSFNNIKSNLIIPLESIISFADPFGNFGLQLLSQKKETLKKGKQENKNENNVIDFKKFIKN